MLTKSIIQCMVMHEHFNESNSLGLGHIISFSSLPASSFFLSHQGLFVPLVAKGGQLSPFIVGTLLEQSQKIAF